MDPAAFRCGAIALIGRPNVGKSTLQNALIGQKISITSRKPQTTRRSLRGVLTTATAQFIFVDTPGFQTRHRGALNRAMSRSVRSALGAVDVVALVVEAGRFGAEDRAALKLAPAGTALFLVVNKTDSIESSRLPAFLKQAAGEAEFDEIVPVSARRRKGLGELLRTLEPSRLPAFLKRAAGEAEFDEIVPVSARRRKGLGELMRTLERYLPEQPAIYSADDITDRNERLLAADFIREKLFRYLGQELPYGADVEIEKFEELPGVRRIYASIVVEKEGHKAIVIGARGAKLKEIATAARLDLEKLFGGKVYLETWVRIRGGWTDDEAALRRMGYG